MLSNYIMSRYTQKGRRQQLAMRDETPGVTIMRDSSTHLVTGFTVDAMKLPVPERTYRASTGSFEIDHSEFTFNFVQLRAASKTRIQSAVSIVMPIVNLRGLDLNVEAYERILAAARGGNLLPFPTDVDARDYQSITYEAQFLRLLINEKLGSVIDFYQMPVEPTLSVNINSVVRITTSPSLLAEVSRWVKEVPGK